MFALFLAGAASDTKAVDSHLRSLERQYMKSVNSLELFDGKMSDEEIDNKVEPPKEEVNDDGKMAYLNMVNQGTDTFKSLADIIDKLNSVESKINQSRKQNL